jgi:hypothetical protein
LCHFGQIGKVQLQGFSIAIDTATVIPSIVIDNVAHIMMRLKICCKVGQLGTQQTTSCGMKEVYEWLKYGIYAT